MIVYNAPWMKATTIQEHSGLDWEMINGLQGRFDAAVIFTVYSQSPLPAALFCYLAEIPLRLAHCRENPYQLLTDWVPETEPHQQIRHEVTRQLDLVASVGCQELDHRLSIQVPKASRQHALGQLQKAGLDPYLPWIIVHPGASAALTALSSRSVCTGCTATCSRRRHASTFHRQSSGKRLDREHSKCNGGPVVLARLASSA